MIGEFGETLALSRLTQAPRSAGTAEKITGSSVKKGRETEGLWLESGEAYRGLETLGLKGTNVT